jgi:outer membrane protein TolC
MNRRPRAGRSRTAASLALALAAVSGCATRATSVRPPSPDAPDLLNVSAVAPAINVGLDGGAGRSPGSTFLLPLPLGEGRNEGRGTSSDGHTSLPAGALAMQRPSPPVPLPAGEGRQTDTPGRADAAIVSTSAEPAPAQLPRPEIDLNAGLMGPTPPLPTPTATTPPTIPQSAAPYPIDLSAALRLADSQNPIIGEARVLILGALAERQAARALLLPYLNAGTNYHDHTGPIERSSGSILSLTSQTLYFGGGAGAFGSNTVNIPAVNIFSPLTDAIFLPLAAQQRVVGARFTASDTANKVLLEVAALYLDLMGAEAILEARREIAAESDRVAASVAAFAETGQGRKSDANRAEADRRLFQVAIQKAEERVAVASALLSQRLNLDPSAQLRPIAGPLEPVELINPEAPPDELIRAAVARRPDLAAREALVAQADYRVQQEKFRPLLPTIWLGFSGGAFGGGSNMTTTPLGSFAGRTDFDIRAYWTVLNLGAGNLSLIKQRKAQAGQAMADRSVVINQIRAEVSASRAESLALRSQVRVARAGLQTAEDGYRQDQARLRESLSLPIEALDSLRLLSDAKVTLIEAITRANRTQFALFVSLGAPPPLEHPGEF